MSGFNLAGLVGGYEHSQDHSADLKMKAAQLAQYQQQLDAEKQKLASMAAAATAGGFGGPNGGAPAPPIPTGPVGGGGAAGPPQGAPASLPAPAPMPGATAMPQAPAGPQGQAGMAGNPQAGGGPSPGPQGGPADDPQGQGVDSQMSGVTRPTGSSFMDDRRTLSSIYRDLKARNPKLDPVTAFQAADLFIGQMKGIDSGQRNFLNMLNQNSKIDMETQKALLESHDRERAQDVIIEGLKAKLENAVKLQRLRGATAVTVGEGHDRARTTAAATGAGARLGAAGIAAGASNYRADAGVKGAGIRADAGVKGAAIRADASREVAGTNREARENVTAVSNGKPPPYAPDGEGGPTATGPGGKKVRWNGAAWVPIAPAR